MGKKSKEVVKKQNNMVRKDARRKKIRLAKRKIKNRNKETSHASMIKWSPSPDKKKKTGTKVKGRKKFINVGSCERLPWSPGLRGKGNLSMGKLRWGGTCKKEGEVLTRERGHPLKRT